MLSEAIVTKLLKYMLIGIGGTALDFGLTYLLKEKAKINKYVANSIGYTSAATSNYIFNRIWTFDNTNPQIITQFLIFTSISLIGLGLTNLFIWVFNEKFGINFYVSKVMALFLVLIWTFTAHNLITFSDLIDSNLF
jgi:putative flippase GtrA